MTAMALGAPLAPPGWGRTRPVAAPSMWRQPEPWTVAVLLFTGMVVLARHPLAQLIGTEAAAPGTVSTVSVAALPTPAAVLPSVAAAAPQIAPAPTHEPRDPFQPLLTESGAARPATTTAGRTVPSEPGGGTSGCAGELRRVQVGETLWSLAAEVVAGPGKIDVTWRRIYAANRTAVGPDPAMLRVGTQLCLPR